VRPFLLLIAPVRADPDFALKMATVRDLCSARGLDCRLPSVNPTPFNLAAELAVIRDAHRIIADLSYGRPSCYYELGLVEASQKRAVLIAGAGTEIFQHAEHGPVAYFDDFEGYAALVGSLLDG
jgi:hypothetical protein